MYDFHGMHQCVAQFALIPNQCKRSPIVGLEQHVDLIDDVDSVNMLIYMECVTASHGLLIPNQCNDVMNDASM